MADNVIHGEGKPRIGIPTEVIWSGTNSAADATSITLSGSPDLTTLDDQWGLVNFIIWGQTAGAESTHGKITAFDDGTDVITVESWSNGTPTTGDNNYIQGKRLDLPYCQRLTERFSPDFRVHKLYDGDIKRIKKGFYYSAQLDYARYMHKDEMELLRDLYNRNFDHFVFYPRVDNTALFYKVDIAPDTEVAFYQLRQHQGHGGIVIDLIGLTRLDRIPFIDPAQSLAGVVTDDDDIYMTDDDGIYLTED